MSSVAGESEKSASAIVSDGMSGTQKQPKPIQALISQFNDQTSGTQSGVSSPRGNEASSPRGHTRAGEVDTVNNTQKQDATSKQSPSTKSATASGSEADTAAKASHVSEGDTVQKLLDRCSKLEARLSRQNAAVLEFEHELQVYEAGAHQALLILGIEDGLRGLTSEAAVKQMELCIRTLLDSESHLLNRAEEMHDEILQHKELESAIMLKLNGYIVKEEAEKAAKEKQESEKQSAASEASAAASAAAAQSDQYIQVRTSSNTTKFVVRGRSACGPQKSRMS